jgi:hypothetical protein
VVCVLYEFAHNIFPDIFALFCAFVVAGDKAYGKRPHGGGTANRTFAIRFIAWNQGSALPVLNTNGKPETAGIEHED